MEILNDQGSVLIRSAPAFRWYVRLERWCVCARYGMAYLFIYPKWELPKIWWYPKGYDLYLGPFAFSWRKR